MPEFSIPKPEATLSARPTRPLGWFRSLTDFVAKRARRGPERRGLGWTIFATPVALLICLGLLLQHLTPQTMRDLSLALGAFTSWQWAGSIGFAGLSYIAIGRNDAAAHDLLNTGVDQRRARRAGMKAVALAQAVGFGTLTAAFARKRCLPELGMWPLARLSVVASFAFLAALGGLGILAFLYSRTGTIWLPLSALALGIVLIRRSASYVGLPGLSASNMLRVVFWTGLDTGFAACALYVFLPEAAGIGLGWVICVYLLALGAGLVSQSPGGLGALELTMVVLLPQVPVGPLLAALFAYRLTYHALPAVISVILLFGAARPAPVASLLPAPLKTAQRAAHRVGQGDWGLIHQGATALLNRDQSQGWLTRQTFSTLVVLGRPLGRPPLGAVRDLGRSTGRGLLLYKCDRRTAAQARLAGWPVLRLAQNAILSPAAWSVDGVTRRQLRRKLRSATKSGLRIDSRPGRLPHDDMRRINALWTTAHGRERGFSMGRYAPELVVRQQVILGFVQDQLVGYATFHKTRDEWGLDLMRVDPAAPSGTMHALIAAAISLARERQVPRVSLAASPSARLPLPNVLSARGTHQFKASFGPKWEPLYAAAPGRVALLVGLVNTTLAIQWPAPLPKPPRERRRWPRKSRFRFDLARPTCDAQDRETQPAALGPGHDTAQPRNGPNDQRPDKPA